MLLDGKSSKPGKSVTLVGYGQRQVGHTHIGISSSHRQHIRQLNSSHLVGNQRDSSTHLGQSNIPQPAQITSRQVVTTEGSFIRIHSGHPIVIEFTIRGSVTSQNDFMIAHSQTPAQRNSVTRNPVLSCAYFLTLTTTRTQYPDPRNQKQKTENPNLSDTPKLALLT